MVMIILNINTYFHAFLIISNAVMANRNTWVSRLVVITSVANLVQMIRKAGKDKLKWRMIYCLRQSFPNCLNSSVYPEGLLR